MIETISFEEPNIIGFRLDGKIDDESYDQAVAAIQAALKNHERICIYAEVERLGGMSLETFLENFKVKFGFLRQLERFEKEAIVSDKEWIETLTKIGDTLFPGVKVKHFSFDDKDEALAWIKS